MNNEIKMSVSSMTRKRLDKELSNRHQCSTDVQSCLRQDALDKKAVYVLFQDGDKSAEYSLMQIKNNYDKDVYNGDIGIIESVNETDRTLKVNFDGRSVEYDISELDELVHAYATTIHKSQGSEYPVVVMPVMMNHYVMLQRNLIYTGITRAKKILVIVGTRKALTYAVKNVTVTNRNTLLKERLGTEIRSSISEGKII